MNRQAYNSNYTSDNRRAFFCFVAQRFSSALDRCGGGTGGCQKSHAAKACCAALLMMAWTAEAATVSWVGGNGDWNTAANWSTGALPGANDDVVIGPTNTSITVTHSSGTHSVKSLMSQRAFQLTGGSLTVSNTVQVNNTFTLAGGTLIRATVLQGTNGGSFTVNGSGTLDGVTVNGVLDVGNSVNGSSLTVTNGLVLNGTALVGNPTNNNHGYISFAGSQTLSGNGAVVFGAANDSYNGWVNGVLLANAGTTLTISAGITVRGQSGHLGYSPYYGGPQNATVINQGTITADVSGGVIYIRGQSLINQGVLAASNGGQLDVEDIAGNVGQVSLIAGSTLTLNGTYTNNLALNLTAGAVLSLNGSWANTGSIGATNATVNLGGSSPQTGTMVLPGSTLNVVGSFSAAQLAAIQYSAGAVRIGSGGTVDNTGNTLLLTGATGAWLMNGGTLRGGAVSCSGGAQLVCNGNGGTLDGVTVNGTLDVGCTYNVYFGSRVTVVNGLVLNGTALVGNPTNNNHGYISFAGSQTLSGNGAVVFGAANDSYNGWVNGVLLANAGTTLTISAGITVRGQSGHLGYSPYYGGAQNATVINQGTITADVSGGVIYIRGQALVNQGKLQASGGFLDVESQYPSNAGDIQAFGSGVVDFNGSPSFDALHILTSQPGATVRVSGNLLGTTRNVGQYSPLGTLVLDGSGTALAPQFFEVMGKDWGTSQVGFIHNFSYGIVNLANNTYVKLVDQSDNSTGTGQEALYVNLLVVPAGTTLDLNNLHVYARAAQMAGTVLHGSVVQIPSSGPISAGTATLGTISAAGEMNEWTFFARAGEWVTVVVDPGSGGGTPPYLNYVYVQLVDTNSTVLASKTNAASGQVVQLSNVPVPADGTYRVQVRAAPSQSASTGNYLITVWDVTPVVASLTLNQIVTGNIQTPYSVNRWDFAALAGGQVRFDLVNTYGPALAFDLIGPAGWYGFTNVTADSALVTLPSSGNYSVVAHGTGGQFGGQYAFELLQTPQTNLSLGTTFQGQFVGSGQAQLYQFTLPTGSPLQVVVNNLMTNNHCEIYARLGAPPTRSTYDYRAAVAGVPNQQLLIPMATSGTWYVLVYADNIPTPGGYTITASSASVLLFSVTPDRSGRNAPITITLTGAGFDSSSAVQFIDGGNNVYPATSTAVDSFTQITATEAASTLAPGTYSIRVSLGSGASATLTNAFAVSTGGIANLAASLAVPGSVGYHMPATIFVRCENNGDAQTPAPLLVVRVYQNGREGAFLTMAASAMAQGLWTSAEPSGFYHNVQLLPATRVPGVLQPGENYGMGDTVPIYYAGWQQPWDFSYSPITWVLGVIKADDSTPADWSSMKDGMRPATISADAWDALWYAFTARAGSTWGDYVRMIDDNAYYLGRLGLRVFDVGKLLSFQFMQADGLCPLTTLASSMDASVQAPGLALTFSRSYAEPISRRYVLGPLGRGWSHNWQYSLQQSSDGTVTITGPGGGQRVFQPDTRGGYFAEAGDYGTLAPASGGAFTLTENSGLFYYYAAGGKLGYMEDLNGNRITLGYTGSLLTSLAHSSGQTIQLAYNGAGRIQTVTDHLGQQTILTYDGANEHLVGAQYADGRTATYTYHTTGTPGQLHALTGIASSCCNWRYFTYDPLGRLVGTYLAGNAEVLTFGYDTGKVTVTDALGNATKFYYDHRGTLAKAEDALGNAVHLTFDDSYNLVSIMDPTGRSYNYAYDSKGNVLRSTDPMGHSSEFSFTSAYNRLASVTDAKRNLTRYSYDRFIREVPVWGVGGKFHG